MLIVAIIVLAVILLALVMKPVKQAEPKRHRRGSDSPVTPLDGGTMMHDSSRTDDADLTPGGGDFGGGGSSGEWDDPGDSGCDGDSDGGGDGGGDDGD
jgi:hypothetical protein